MTHVPFLVAAYAVFVLGREAGKAWVAERLGPAGGSAQEHPTR